MEVQATLGEFIDSRKRKGCKTLATYARQCRMYARYFDDKGVWDTAEITPELLQQYLAAAHDQGLNSHTLASYRRRLAVFINWCGAMGYLPAGIMRSPRPGGRPRSARHPHTEKQGEPLAQYLRHLEARGLSVCTLRNYRSDIEGLLSYLSQRGTNYLVLDRHTMRDYLIALKDGGTAPASLRRKLSTIRLFYRWLAREGHIANNPLSGVNGLPKIPYRLPDIISREEAEALLEAPDGDTPIGTRDRAILELLYATGIRLEEIRGLDLYHVDLHERVLRVTGKGNKEREVLLGEPACKALDDYLHARLLVASLREPALFVNYDGARLSGRSVQKIVRGHALKAGVGQRVHPHTLRHTFATHMHDGGADLRVVQHLLGHANATTTQIYTHVTAERQQSVYREAWGRRYGQPRGSDPAQEEERRRRLWYLEDVGALDDSEPNAWQPSEKAPPGFILLEPTLADTLEAVRMRPGLTAVQLASVFSLSYGRIKSRLDLLKKGSHVTTKGAGTRNQPHRHYAQGSLLIVRSKPRAVRSYWLSRFTPSANNGNGHKAAENKCHTLTQIPRAAALLEAEREQRQTALSVSPPEGVTRP